MRNQLEAAEVQLNDPFGRVSRRQQQAYAMFRDQLRQQGVDTPLKVRLARTKLGDTALQMTLVVCVLFGGMAVFFPALQGMAVVVACLVLVWLASSFLQTRAHLNNYLNELADAERRARQDPPSPPISQE